MVSLYPWACQVVGVHVALCVLSSGLPCGLTFACWRTDDSIADPYRVLFEGKLGVSC